MEAGATAVKANGASNSSDLTRLAFAEKLAILAKSKGISQSELAERIDISRVSINRFFKGKSSIRTKDLIQLLQVLDIDLEEVIEQQLNSKLRGQSPQIAEPQGHSQVYEDLISVIDNLDSQARSNVFEQVIWWGRCVLNEPARRASERLHNQIHQNNVKAVAAI
jgi:transcriptional regulator with XRE-family HTH domain